MGAGVRNGEGAWGGALFSNGQSGSGVWGMGKPLQLPLNYDRTDQIQFSSL
jgi:hypothetical protein